MCVSRIRACSPGNGFWGQDESGSSLMELERTEGGSGTKGALALAPLSAPLVSCFKTYKKALRNLTMRSGAEERGSRENQAYT